MAALDLPSGSRVYLDANLLIYAVEQIAPYHATIRSMFARFDRGELDFVTSELSLAEVLVKPIQTDSAADQQTYQSLLSRDGPFEIVPVERTVLLAAAKLRATSRIPLADSIHWASAVQSACDIFFTNNQRLKSLPDIRVLVLSEHLTA